MSSLTALQRTILATVAGRTVTAGELCDLCKLTTTQTNNVVRTLYTAGLVHQGQHGWQATAAGERALAKANDTAWKVAPVSKRLWWGLLALLSWLGAVLLLSQLGQDATAYILSLAGLTVCVLMLIDALAGDITRRALGIAPDKEGSRR